jgi:hypothetical protein
VTRRFALPLRFPSRLFLLAWGVRRGHAHVDIDRGARRVRAVFGFWSVETDLANVERWEISGPYRWWTAIGLRSSPPFRDYTFGTSAHGGVTLTFREPVRFGRIFSAASLTVTVADLAGLAAALTEGGIPGQDVRSRR